ncbi:MAG: hypothetical protein JRD04_03775 [Deltaproteobacteria bacterium]|nr:hypothetical protein [Deltaproteobacteria bacterium]
MKKFFIALSVLAALMLSVVPSQALIGVPDDAPGTDAVVPFICDISGTTGLNTLIVFTDVGILDGIDFHYTINTVRSVTVFDDTLTGTHGDVVSTDAFTEIAKMASAIRSSLEVDIDGDGVNDHYAGYIYYDNEVGTDVNSVVGQFYFVNLANGIAAAANVPMKEYNAALPVAFQAQMAPAAQFVELFSANALQGAEDLQAGLAAPTDATSFGLYPRFYIGASGDSTWLIFWKSANTIPGTLHINFWDTAEDKVSSNIPLDDELTIIDLEPYLPAGLFANYPKEGWIDLEWDTNTAALRNLEILGWTYQQAVSGTGALNWTVLTPMWRDLP